MQVTGSDGLWVPPVTSDLSHARAISITRLPYRRRRAGRIPKPAGLLIGREWELDAIRYALLYDDVRLLTLWGPAGIGKTRLALAAATDPELARAFQDVVFVDLAPLTEANHVIARREVRLLQCSTQCALVARSARVCVADAVQSRVRRIAKRVDRQAQYRLDDLRDII